MIAARFKTTGSGQVLDLSKIGGSDMAAVVGLSPWGSAWDVWSRIVHGVDNVRETERMRWGSLHEPVIAGEWKRRFDDGRKWSQGETRAFEKWPWLRVSTDLECAETKSILEIKTVDSRSRPRWVTPAGLAVPDFVEIQVQTYLHALDYDDATVAVLFGGNELNSLDIPRDTDTGAILLEAAAEFVRDYVETGTPPPADSSDACRAWFSRRGSEKKAPRTATRGESDLANEYREISESITELEKQKAELANKILSAIGPDEYGLAGDFGRMLAPFSKPKTSTKWKDLVEELKPHVDAAIVADALETHSKIGESRRTLRGYWTE